MFPDRVLVHADIYDVFVSKMKTAVEGLTVPPSQYACHTMGVYVTYFRWETLRNIRPTSDQLCH